MKSILHPRSSIFDHPLVRAGSCIVALLTAGTLQGAPEPTAGASSDDETEIQQAARKMAQSVKLSTTVDGTVHELELVGPVLRYGDLPRANDRGSVWIWQRGGRPQAIMELYRGADGRSWAHVVHSLAVEVIHGEIGPGGPAWNPPAAAIKWSTFPEAPAPSDRPAVRARQIKELSQRFTAHEFWDPNNSRYELRLLVQPVYKYGDSRSDVADGAAFLLCHETNPEVVLLIEAAQESDRGAAYRYALARLGHAELHVAFDEKEVWKQSRVANPTARDAYFLVLK